MGDTLRNRPLIVEYRWWICYVVEAVLVFLSLIGIWLGRKSRFLWMMMAGFAFDMVIHLGLGFGLNEVYIMASHWAFAMPICMAYLLKAKGHLPIARIMLLAITAFLWLYNGSLLISYLLGGAS